VTKPYSFLCLVFILLLLSEGCTEERREKTKVDYFRTINIADSLGLDSDMARVLLLPAPLQVVSALHIYDIEYDASLINKFKASTGIDEEYLNALNLGTHTIDLGYAVVNRDLQLGLKYSQSVKTLMGELGISSVVTGNMMKRVEANVASQDSLSKIILEAYAASHHYFQRNQREGIGLLILTGCFIEGLYIASSVENEISSDELQSLLGIHKEYLNNLLLLIQYYNEKQEVADLIVQLALLREEFLDVDLFVNAKEGRARLNSSIPTEKIASIRAKITEIRRTIRE